MWVPVPAGWATSASFVSVLDQAEWCHAGTGLRPARRVCAAIADDLRRPHRRGQGGLKSRCTYERPDLVRRPQAAAHRRRRCRAGHRQTGVCQAAAPAFSLAVKLLHPQARLPRRAHPGDAGADLFSVDEVTIPAGERREVGTGIALAIPEGYAGFVQPRSGLAFKHGIMVVNSPGLIDAGYRGEVRDPYNSGDEPFAVAVGERIAQLVVQRVAEPEFMEAEELPPTVRGAGGFGSSGR